MAGRASIVGAAETSVGKVREHNEDAHFIDTDLGIFAVCDGMGGHAAGEVASGIAVKIVREHWSGEALEKVIDQWLDQGTPDARKALIAEVTSGVIAAHDAIMAEATRDKTKHGMGTTIIGALVIGADIVFAQSGDSRAYMVRDGIAMQLTEDHTLLARLLAAGVDVDTSNEGGRFKSMLTNALGIGTECKAATFVVPLADGDRFLLCSDGITEYVQEAEIGEVLSGQPSPARAAQRLVELALQRGGGDNATALVIRVLEAGETARPAELLHRENKAINACPLWAKITPQGRLRALRIALPRDHAIDTKVPAHTLGDRVAWIIVDGEVEQDGVLRGPGSLLYPEALLKEAPLPDKDGLAIAQSDVRALALRCDDFHEICEDDAELGELLTAALAAEIATRKARAVTATAIADTPVAIPKLVVDNSSEKSELETAPTDPNMRVVMPQHAASSLKPPPKPTSPIAAKRISSTPPMGKPTQPMGVVGIATSATIPPPISNKERERSNTAPDGLAVPRTGTKDGPVVPARAPLKGGQSAERLIVPKSEQGAADAQVDQVFDRFASPAALKTNPGIGSVEKAPSRSLPLPAPPDEEEESGESEIMIEADEPPRAEPYVLLGKPKKARAIGEASDPEISIERLVELEVEEPMNQRDEPSAPEIVILQPGRPITADDTKLVAGSIDSNKKR
ncbi:MAG TPA: protein phosphatase 2C domain-containing protein [Kofleriaceae bacterium]